MVKFTIFFLASILFLDARTHTESYYQNFGEWFFQGAEATLEDGTECDILTETHAIEVDFAKKWYEAIGQSLHYAHITGKMAGVLLILESDTDRRFSDRLIAVRDAFDLPIDVFILEMWDGHFFVDILIINNGM